MTQDNFYNELQKIKSRAMAVNQALELEQEASLLAAKELARKSSELAQQSAKRDADFKIDELKRVKKENAAICKDFADKWKSAFEATQMNAQATSANMGAIFAKSNDNMFDDFVDILNSSDPMKNLANILTGGLFGGFFADGGRPAENKISLVGERGPELFVPDTAGTILPNESLKTQSTPTIVVNQQFTFQSLDPVSNMKMLNAQKAQIQSWMVEGIKANQNGLRNAVQSA